MRNQEGLSQHDIERCLWAWDLLGGNSVCELNVDEAHRAASRTRFNESKRVVILGADVLPGIGFSARDRMSDLACLAHELAHAQRFFANFDRPTEEPGKLLDEAEASIHASFNSVLNSHDRDVLIEDARDCLSEWLKQTRTP